MSQPNPSENQQEVNINSSQIEGQSSQAGRDSTQIQGSGNTVKFETINVLPRKEADDSLSRKDFKLRQRLLDTVESAAERYLEEGLHCGTLINLIKEKIPDLVNPLLDIKIGKNSTSYFPESVGIIDIFNQKTIAGKLLILGEPGVGKTIALMELARHLVFQARNNSNAPLPILLNLSSWNSNKIADWLISELESVYDISIDKKRGRQFLAEQKLVLLLDHLNELEGRQQIECLRAINGFLKDEIISPEYLVVACRFDEYKRCRLPLKLNAAIHLRSLTELQIQEYLEKIGQQDLWTDLKNDSSLLRVTQTPLFLFIIMSLANEKSTLNEWKSCKSDKERHQYLFNAYIQRILKKATQNKQYSKKSHTREIIVWLKWLSKTLKENSQTEFLIEKIQPSCLKIRFHRNLYGFLVAFLIGIIILPICILLSALFFSTTQYTNVLDTLETCTNNCTELNSELQQFLNSPPWLSWNTAVAVTGLLISVSISIVIGFFFKEIQPVETLKFPGGEVINAMKFAGMWERLLGILFANMRIPESTGFTGDPRNFLFLFDWVNSLVRSLVGFLIPITAPIRGLLNGLRGPEIDIERRAFPNQGIYRSAKHAAIFALLFGILGLVFGLIAGIIFYETLVREPEVRQTIELALRYSFIGGLIGGLAGGLFAGMACVQHFALRLVLWRAKLIPWNYARFLNYATEWLLLQRVGGRYRFIHDLLREHFAEM